MTAPDSWPTDGGRLRLRRPTLGDLDVAFGNHSDPRTNVHNPAGPDRDRAASRRRLDEWLEHWERYGFGYWVVETTGSTADPRSPIVGFSGVRNELWLGEQVLNLYYRFAPEHWRQGYAGEVARHVVAWAGTWHPNRPVLARTTLDNVDSQRTAAAAGLVRRPELEKLDNGIHAVILVSQWPNADG